MSSPIAIPRTNVNSAARDPVEVSSSVSSNASSTTGLYVPVHKRGGSSVSSSPTSVPPATPTRSKNRKSNSRSRSPGKGGRAVPIHDHHDIVMKGSSIDSHIPHNTIIPNQAQHYTISDLLSLAPHAHIASSQLEGVHSAMDLIASTMSKSGAKDKRRTPGRGRDQQPKAQRVSVAAEGPKRRRGVWGWKPHEHAGAGVVAEGNWRHAPALVFSQA